MLSEINSREFMASSLLVFSPILAQSIHHSLSHTEVHLGRLNSVNVRSILKVNRHFCSFFCSQSRQFHTNLYGEGDREVELVQEVRVPIYWSNSSKASEESEWLRVTLQKWLDDEYCPEETNLEISKVAASSYYKSLIAKQTDLGDILLTMAKDLESISYQESFHGAFSSANAAISLIMQRIEQEQ